MIWAEPYRSFSETSTRGKVHHRSSSTQDLLLTQSVNYRLNLIVLGDTRLRPGSGILSVLSSYLPLRKKRNPLIYPEDGIRFKTATDVCG